MPLLHIHEASVSDSLAQAQKSGTSISNVSRVGKHLTLQAEEKAPGRTCSLTTGMGESAGMHPSQSHCSWKLGSCSSLNTARTLDASVDFPPRLFPPALQMAVLLHSSHFNLFTPLFSTCNAVTLCGSVLHLPETLTQKSRPRMLLSGGLRH